MKILSIDTSSNICSCSLLENQTILKELQIKDEKTHSEKLMPLLHKLLESTNITLDNIDLMACNKGPGSFTGIRIGIATVKAIAEVKQIPVIGISSLEGLAFQILNAKNIICSLIDARNNQVYCGIFDQQHRLLENYLADDIHIIINTLQKYNVSITFVGNGAILHKDVLQNNIANAVFTDVYQQASSTIGIAAYYHFKNGEKENADTLLPLYLRKSQAERMKELHATSNNH